MGKPKNNSSGTFVKKFRTLRVSRVPIKEFKVTKKRIKKSGLKSSEEEEEDV